MAEPGAAHPDELPLSERSTLRLLTELLWVPLGLALFVGLSFLQSNAGWVQGLICFSAGLILGLYLSVVRGHLRELRRRW